MNRKTSFAKFIRSVTVPPVLVISLLLILYVYKKSIFHNGYDLWLSILFLALVPIAAYPLQPLVKKYRDNKREGQRNLAFVLSLCGYIAAVLYGLITHVTKELFFLFVTYFYSVIILLIFNKLLKFRSSGHACGTIGPLVVGIYFFGWTAFIPCCILFVLTCWASLRLKRHTMQELIGGCLSCLSAFALAYVSI